MATHSRWIARRAADLAESPTLALLAQAAALGARGHRVIGFHIGEPDFGILPNVARAIKDAVDRGRTTYTHQAGIRELREALSAYYSVQFGLHYDADHIVVTAGPKDTIFKLMGTVVTPGTGSSCSTPTGRPTGNRSGSSTDGRSSCRGTRTIWATGWTPWMMP